MTCCTHCGTDVGTVYYGLCGECLRKAATSLVRPLTDENKKLRDTIATLQGISADVYLKSENSRLARENESLRRAVSEAQDKETMVNELHDLARRILGLDKEPDYDD